MNKLVLPFLCLLLVVSALSASAGSGAQSDSPAVNKEEKKIKPGEENKRQEIKGIKGADITKIPPVKSE